MDTAIISDSSSVYLPVALNANLPKALLIMYNTMMTKKYILRTLALSSLLIPSIAIAYVSPEEALISDDNQFIDASGFPLRRETAQRVADQQASAAAWRNGVQDSLAARNAQGVPESLHGAAAETAEDQLQQLINALNKAKLGTDTSAESSSAASSEMTAEDIRNKKILDRVAKQQRDAEIIAEAERLNALRGSTEVLHSGAPLTDTGPATWIVLIVIAAAAMWILRTARDMEKVEEREE